MHHPMPTIFIGHGNPMNAIQRNSYTEGWSAWARQITRPKAILAISAHWYISETAVTAMATPKTIHDFGGFPRELFDKQYPAPGDPALAKRVQELLLPLPVRGDMHWGLDHGTWTVVCHLFPKADIPVVQLSIDETQPPFVHYQLGRHLAPLRDEGVLVLGSGNLVHNLHAYAWDRQNVDPFDWAVRFEQQARNALLAGDDAPLIDLASFGADARLAAPTLDHYLPLLYVLALRRPGESVHFPVEGFDGGSISMLAVSFGETQSSDDDIAVTV